MFRFVTRRLLVSIPILLVGSVLVFTLVKLSGDPLEDLRLRPGINPSIISQREHQLGLDKPLPEQYVTWVTNFARGDWGTDNSNLPVRPQIFRALGTTMRLVLVAQLLAVILGLIVGVVSAVRQYSFFDYASTGMAFLFFAIPAFCVGVLLKEFGALRFNDWLESMGHSRWISTIGDRTPNFCTPKTPQNCSVGSQALDIFGHLLLPTLTLMLISFAAYSRFQRASMLETLSSDYVRSGRAKGISEKRVIFRHAFRNALIPVTTLVALDFAAILGGAIITETIFGWQGMGALFRTGLAKVDPNILLAWMMVTAVAVVLFNLVSDILYAYLDPRIRIG